MNQQPSSNITAVYCSNYSIGLEYNVPKEHAKNAMVILCEGDQDRYCRKHIRTTHLPLQGNVVLTTNRKGSFTVTVQGRRDSRGFPNVFDFDECFTTPRVGNTPASTYIVTLIVSVIAAVVICVILAILFILLVNQHKRKPKNIVLKTSEEKCSDDCLSSNPNHFSSVNLYLVFVNDNSYHEKTMAKFASYLQQDLGFHVIFELWEQRIVNCNYSEWIENAMDDANKIVIVWSQGATKRWQGKYVLDDSKDVDTFTPVVRRWLADKLHHRNLNKYFLVHFPYTRPDDIPGKIRETAQSDCFRLMKDMEKLCFLLRDTERYIPGQTLHLPQAGNDMYCLSNVTRMGPSLKKTIDDATYFARTTLDWFNEPVTSEETPDEACSLTDNSCHNIGIGLQHSERKNEGELFLQIQSPPDVNACKDEGEVLLPISPPPIDVDVQQRNLCIPPKAPLDSDTDGMRALQMINERTESLCIEYPF